MFKLLRFLLLCVAVGCDSGGDVEERQIAKVMPVFSKAAAVYSEARLLQTNSESARVELGEDVVLATMRKMEIEELLCPVNRETLYYLVDPSNKGIPTLISKGPDNRDWDGFVSYGTKISVVEKATVERYLSSNEYRAFPNAR